MVKRRSWLEVELCIVSFELYELILVLVRLTSTEYEYVPYGVPRKLTYEYE